MVNERQTPRLALFLTQTDRYGTPYWNFTPVLVEPSTTQLQPNGEPRVTLRNLTNEHPLDNFKAYMWAAGSGGLPRYESTYYAEYVDVPSVTIGKAQAMVKTLTRVARVLDVADSVDGRPAHFGQYMMRVARALGITEVVVRTDTERVHSYDQMRFRILTLAEGSDHVAAVIRQYISDGTLAA